jgi:hypothetical protein
VASSGAAADLLESTGALVGIRALLSFAVPHLVQAELSAGFAATMEESVDGRLAWHEIGTAAGAGFAGSAGAASAARVAQSVKFAKETWPLLHMLMPHVGQAAAWAGVDAGRQQLDGGHQSLRELLLSASLAGAGSAMAGRLPTVARAYLGRQSAEQMLADGVDLSLHEGETLGHTLTKHVNVTDADLMDRFATERKRKFLSRFTDEATAEAAINDVLRADREHVLAIFAGDEVQPFIRADLGRVIGTVIPRGGEPVAATQLVVRFARDNDGFYIVTAHPELPR